MPNPIRLFCERCAKGFTPIQKFGLSAFLMVYIVSPINLLPFIPIDEMGALAAMIKILMSPTLRNLGGPELTAEPSNS